VRVAEWRADARAAADAAERSTLAAAEPLTRDRLAELAEDGALYRAELHYGLCTVMYGASGMAAPRAAMERWRVNGAMRAWQRQPDRWELPIKYGLRGYAIVSAENVAQFHLAEDCSAAAAIDAYHRAARAAHDATAAESATAEDATDGR
jgi:hypothetical protein